MLVKSDEKVLDLREHLRGGLGTLVFAQIVQPNQIKNVKLFAVITVDAGCSLGQHAHEGETEFFYMLTGELVMDDHGEEKVVRPGDTLITGGGNYHSARNVSGQPATYLAVIVTE